MYGFAYGPYDTGGVRTDLFNKIFLFRDISSKKILLKEFLKLIDHIKLTFLFQV